MAQNSEWNEGIADQNITSWAEESSVPAPTTIFAANVPAAAAAPAVPVDDWSAPVAQVILHFSILNVLIFHCYSSLECSFISGSRMEFCRTWKLGQFHCCWKLELITS